MIFSIGMVAFASPKIPPICDVTGLPHEYEYVERRVIRNINDFHISSRI